MDLFAVGVQLFSCAVLNLLFFLDKRKAALGTVRPVRGQQHGVHAAEPSISDPEYYGFGFAMAAALSVCAGLLVLSHKLERLEYENSCSSRRPYERLPMKHPPYAG